jgi:hypothetical protein
MAHFAEIDDRNIVKRVIVIDNSLESIGSQWCYDTFGGTWIQTSYNANIRKNFAGIDYYYDAFLDAFIPPQPFRSWVLDETTCTWIPPVPYPDDGNVYRWNEFTRNWQQVEI